MNKIKIKSLKKSFESGEELLTVFDIDEIEFSSKETYAITGSSGSGKSTFLQIIAGLDNPTEGTVHIEGTIPKDLTGEGSLNIHKINKKTINKIRRNNFGFIYQKNFLMKGINVIDNLLIVNNNKERANSLLDSVGLKDKKKSFYSKLSGGERQRVSICRALMNEPDFIFADEPTGSLDVNNKKVIWDLLMELRKSHNFGLIMVTHDNELASECENIYFLSNKALLKQK